MAVMSQFPKRNGWTIAAHAGDRAPDKTQRLLNRAVRDTFAAMGVVRLARTVSFGPRCDGSMRPRLALIRGRGDGLKWTQLVGRLEVVPPALDDRLAVAFPEDGGEAVQVEAEVAGAVWGVAEVVE
jgi:hypothetical protein